MNNNSRYRVSDDGTITKIGKEDDSPHLKIIHVGRCIWAIIIVVIIGIVIVACNSSDTTPSTTYLNVSDDDIYMSAEGGSTEIMVSTDGDWDIDEDVESWGNLRKYSNSVTLRLDPNSSSSSRTDLFSIRSGSYTKWISITQYGDTSPKADIESIWVDHNVYQYGQKGMKIHIDFTVKNMKGKQIRVYAYFYYGDNENPLYDRYGNNLAFSKSGIPDYDESLFEDAQIFVPYNGLNMRPGAGSIDLSFDISIRTLSGTELDRANNIQFTYTQN